MESMDEKHLREKYAIENDDWERTPVSVRMIVLLLDGKIEELEGHLKDIKDLKKQLNEKVTRNSENSHSPSSSDPIGFESPRKKGVVKLKDDRNQLGTEITLIARIALHLSYSDLTTLKLESTMWLFITVEGLEPTSNAAERAIRPAVLWQRTSFGSQSEAGSIFVARMLTVVTSLRSPNRNVLEFMTEAIRSSRRGSSSPSLLPKEGSSADSISLAA
jgi:hypothetical protein